MSGGVSGGVSGGASDGVSDDAHVDPNAGSTAAALAPDASPFERVGGEAAVRGLVDRFYDLMDLEPVYADLRAVHPDTLEGSRDKLFWFLCGWLGGPQHYTERFGHPMLRARHMPYRIGINERDQWMACMQQAMSERRLDAALAQRLGESFFGTADWMRNR